MTIKQPWMVALMMVLLLVYVKAQAAVTCQNSTVYPAMSITPTFNVTSYAGNDMPIGSTIYRNQVNLSHLVGINCTAGFALSTQTTISDEPVGPAVVMSGLAYGNGTGPVYPTNVSGVGVLFFENNTIFSTAYPINGSISMAGAGDYGFSVQFDVVLVKTGPIASGSVVNASSFPHVTYRIPAQTPYAGLPLRPLVVSFAGSVQFITSTCTTPDVNVKMGTYDIADYFTKVGSATPWMDASIVLESCPTFQGYHANTGTGQTTTDSGSSSGTTRKNNIFTVSLSPANTVSGNVIDIDTGDDAAQGIGLQLGYTANNINASATSPATVWTSGATWNVTAPTDGRSTVKIPLAARYYQNTQRVSPGQANAKVIFTIQYK